MEYILFSRLAFGRFIPMFLSGLLVLFMFKGSKSRTSTRLLHLYFLIIFLFHAGYFIAFSWYHPMGAWGWYLSALAPLGLVVFIQFAYRFPEKNFVRESRIALGITVPLALLGLAEYVMKASSAPFISNEKHFNATQSSQLIPLLAVLFYVWIIIVFMRQAYKSEKEEGDKGLLLLFRALLRPRVADAKVARVLGLLVFLELLNAMAIVVFMVFSALSFETLNFATNMMSLVILFLYVMVYFNHAGESVGVTFRLVGSMLMAVLLLLGLVGHMTLQEKDNAYRSKRMAQMRQMVYPLSRGIYESVPEDVVFVYRYHSGEAPEILYTRNRDIHVDNILRYWFEPPRVAQLKDAGNPGDPLQDEDGYVRRDRAFLQIDGVNYYHFAATLDDRIYGAVYDYIAYRKEMDTRAGTLIMLVLIASVITIVTFPVLFRTGLLRPMQLLLEGVHRADQGDYDVVVDISYRDEIGTLAHSFNSMIASLKKNRENFLSQAGELSEVSSSVTRVSQELKGEMDNQGSSLEETAAAMEEVGASIDSIAAKTGDQDRIIKETDEVIGRYISSLEGIDDAARNAVELGNQSRSHAEKSVLKLEEMIAGMSAISESSDAIGEITSMINELSEQTNLLSLNASIEAARAGEQGRGFAVVAEEIGKLADRSILQAKSIQQHVQNTLQNIDSEKEIIDSSSSMIREILNAANRVNEAIQKIMDLTREQVELARGVQKNMTIVSEGSEDILNSTNEQKQTVDEINKSIDHLSAIMYDVLTMGEKLVQSVASMEDRAETLRSLARMDEE